MCSIITQVQLRSVNTHFLPSPRSVFQSCAVSESNFIRLHGAQSTATPRQPVNWLQAGEMLRAGKKQQIELHFRVQLRIVVTTFSWHKVWLKLTNYISLTKRHLSLLPLWAWEDEEKMISSHASRWNAYYVTVEGPQLQWICVLCKPECPSSHLINRSVMKLWK